MPSTEDDRMVRLLTEKLKAGIMHPGDAMRKPMALSLPIFRTTAGMPREMAQQMDITAKTMAEAIVHTIKAEGGVDLVDREQHATLQRSVAERPAGRHQMKVHCRCDRGRSDPLLILTLDESQDHIVVDGRQIINGLSQRNIDCPHEIPS